MKRYYKKNGRSLAAFLIVNLLAAASSVLMSFLLGLFADSAMEGDFSRVWKIALVTFCYLVVETGFSFLMDYTRNVFVQRVGRDLRSDTVRKIERLSETEKSKTDDGSLFSLMNNDIDTIQQEYLASLGAIYFQICCFVLAVGSALVIQPLIFLPVAAWMGFSGEKMIAILIMLASPTTPSCYIMAKSMNNDGVLTASVIVTTTLLAAFTLTGWIFILKSVGLIG